MRRIITTTRPRFTSPSRMRQARTRPLSTRADGGAGHNCCPPSRAGTPFIFTFHEALSLSQQHLARRLQFGGAAVTGARPRSHPARGGLCPMTNATCPTRSSSATSPFAASRRSPSPAFLGRGAQLTLAAPVQVDVNELTLITCNAAAAPSTITRHAAVALGRANPSTRKEAGEMRSDEPVCLRRSLARAGLTTRR